MIRSRVVLLMFWLSISCILEAQDSLLFQRIILSDTTCTTESALGIIEKHTGLSFSFNVGLINKRAMVHLSDEPLSLVDVLRNIVKNEALDFRIIGNHLIIYKPLGFSIPPISYPPDSVYYFEIRGRIRDKSDQLPLPYASVRLKNKGIGTVTNEDGRFVLRLSSDNLRDTLLISFVGYKTISEAVSSRVNAQVDYFLRPDYISIQEVVIRKLSPLLLLQNAVSQIKTNYPSKPALLTCFYRETVQQGHRYDMLSEALIEHYKSGYTHGLQSDQIKIIKGRSSEDMTFKDTVKLKLKAGLNALVLLDLVKNQPDFLSEDYRAEYEYSLADIVKENGEDYYLITFRPRSNSLSAIYSGRIILHIKDMAFKQIEFSVDPGYLDRATGLYIVRKPMHLSVKMLQSTYHIGYQKIHGKYYLQQIQSTSEYRIRSKKRLSGSLFSTSLEMAVTDLDTTHVCRFASKEAAGLNDYFTDQVGVYDESFWGPNNFIPPGESLTHALIRLQKQMERKDEE